MTIEARDDVAALQRIGGIVSSILHRMLDAAEPGMTTFLSVKSRIITKGAPIVVTQH